MRKLIIAGAILAAVPLVSSAVSADAPADPGCRGQEVALRNHNSGVFGASENPKASAGPGYFFRQETAAAVQAVKAGCD